MRLRLDMGRDGCGGLDGWYVDNIKVTACETPTQPPPAMLASTTSAKADPKKIEAGESFKVKVAVVASGATPAGTVEIYKGSKLLATGTLGADGKVTIKVSKKRAKAQAGQEHPDREVPRFGDHHREPGRLRGEGEARRRTDAQLSSRPARPSSTGRRLAAMGRTGRLRPFANSVTPVTGTRLGH